MSSLCRAAFVAALVPLFSPLLLVPARAESATGRTLAIKEVRVGFNGKFKAGFWQPIWVTVLAGPAGAKGRLEVVIPDGDQMPAVYRNGEDRGQLDLAAGEQATRLLYARSGPAGASITLQLHGEGGVSWSQIASPLAPPLRSTQELVVGIGPPIGLDEAVGTIRRTADRTMQAATVTTAADLPDRWWGYEGVDVLVLTTSDTAFFGTLSEEQQQAIRDWTLLGGRLILSLGARGESFAAPESPWLPLIPGDFAEVSPLRERSGLEQFTRSELPFEEELFRRQRPMVTRLMNPRGDVLVDEVSSAAGRPLVVHAPAGLGEVTFVAFDLDHPALKSWKGRPRLIAALLAHGPAEQQNSRGEVHHRITHLGYDDLIGQLRAALDQFPGVSLVNFTTVSVLTVAYLLLIGPGDFLFLSRLGLPRHLTWLTFPLVALLVAVLAGAMNSQVHGRSARMNQAEIIDIDLAQHRVRGTLWCHVYSPATAAYRAKLDVSAPPGVVSSATSGWLAWQGLPGSALGGLESRQPALFSREAYEIRGPGQAPAIDDLTIQIASSKALGGTWTATTSLPSQTDLKIDRYGLLAGEFRYPLPIQLSDCLLAHGEKLYRLGTLEPGERVALADLPPLNLEARLTERRVEQSKDVSTPWEQDSVDVPRIVQMLMFHDAARGRSYTGLTDRYQPRLDLSEHVRLGQAVLVGRAEKPVARIAAGDSGVPASAPPLVAGDNLQTWTWYRILLPVNRPAA
jgi:hypothetical protein